MTSMNTQESIFRKVQSGKSNTAHLTNTNRFKKHHKSLLFSIVVEKKKSQTGDVGVFFERLMVCLFWGFFLMIA